MKVAIMGAGAFGTALGGLLVENKYDVDYYDVKGNKKLDQVLSGAEVVVLAVPSGAVSETLPLLPKNLPLVIATKGILTLDTFKDFEDYMILSGPGFADDIKAGKRTRLVATDQRIIKMFSTIYLTFDYTDDERGVLMCGALKNVYAVQAGLMGLIPNTEEHVGFLYAAAQEMKAILVANGAKVETVDLPCGEGDLEITCAKPSRNYEYGMKLRADANYSPEKTVEGLAALEKIKQGDIVVPEEARYLRVLMADDRLERRD